MIVVVLLHSSPMQWIKFFRIVTRLFGSDTEDERKMRGEDRVRFKEVFF